MKRSEALAILSRDHHQSLFVAHKLKRADAGTLAEAREQLERYWNPSGSRHFQLEEELLLPAYARYGDPYDPLVLQVLGDHVTIRGQVQHILRETEPTLEALQALGDALATHVRREERELFPLIERLMPADELMALVQELERASGSPEQTES